MLIGSALIATGLVLAGTFVFFPALRGCGTGTITFHVFGSAGEIVFEGKAFHDGDPVSVLTGCDQVYPIQAQGYTTAFGWGVEFGQWVTDSTGYFEDPNANPTVFHAGSSGGSVALVMALPQGSNINWAGYVVSGKNVTSASGIFRLPTSAQYLTGNAYSPADHLGIWVGIGGFSGGNLWQAGVFIDVYGPEEVYLQPWVEAWPVQNVSVSLPYGSFGEVRLGDSISVSVWYDAANRSDSFRICDLNNTACYSPPSFENFTPNMTTAEWVAEDPGLAPCEYSCAVVPRFSPITFSSPFYTSEAGVLSGFTGPFLRLIGRGGNYTALPRFHIVQWEVPTAFSPVSPDSFEITYSPTCSCR